MRYEKPPTGVGMSVPDTESLQSGTVIETTRDENASYRPVKLTVLAMSMQPALTVAARRDPEIASS